MAEERSIPIPGFFNRLFKDPDFTACAKFLRGIPLFEELGKRDIGYLIQSLFKKSYAQGEPLFEEGDIGRALFIVEEGAVDLIKRTPDGRTQLLATARAGDFFGEMALIEELPRSASAIATIDTTVYLLYRTRLFGLVKARPRVGVIILNQLVKLLSARLRSTSERLVSGAEILVETTVISRYENRIFALMVTSAILFIAYVLLSFLGEIVFLFFVGIVLAYLLNPLIVRLEARGYRRSRVVIGFYLLVTAILILAARILIPLTISMIANQHDRLSEFAGLINTFPADIEQHWLSRLPVGSEQAIAGMEAGRHWLQNSLSGLPAALIAFSPKLLNLLVLPLLTYFPLVEGPGWVNALVRACPRRHVEKVVSLVYQIDAVLGSYLRGLMLDCLLFGIVTFIALRLIGLEYSLELAILAGMVNVIPYLGPFAIAILSSGMAYLQFHDISVIYKVLLIIMVIKLIDDWILQPVIMRNAVELHPLLGLFLIAAGSQLFGFFGLIFAVPTAAAAQAGIRVFYDWYVAETGTKLSPFSPHVARIPSV